MGGKKTEGIKLMEGFKEMALKNGRQKIEGKWEAENRRPKFNRRQRKGIKQKVNGRQRKGIKQKVNGGQMEGEKERKGKQKTLKKWEA